MSTRPKAIELVEEYGKLPLTLKALQDGRCYRDIFDALIKDVGGDVGKAAEIVARAGNPQWAYHMLCDIYGIPKDRRLRLIDVVIEGKYAELAYQILLNIFISGVPEDKRALLFDIVIEGKDAWLTYRTLRYISNIPKDRRLRLINIVIEEKDAQLACWTRLDISGIPEDKRLALKRIERAA